MRTSFVGKASSQDLVLGVCGVGSGNRGSEFVLKRRGAENVNNVETMPRVHGATWVHGRVFDGAALRSVFLKATGQNDSRDRDVDAIGMDDDLITMNVFRSHSARLIHVRDNHDSIKVRQWLLSVQHHPLASFLLAIEFRQMAEHETA